MSRGVHELGALLESRSNQDDNTLGSIFGALDLWNPPFRVQCLEFRGLGSDSYPPWCFVRPWGPVGTGSLDLYGQRNRHSIAHGLTDA